MNPIEWLKTVRDNGSKPSQPPEPPEGSPCENGPNTPRPPETPRGSITVGKKSEIFQSDRDPEDFFSGDESPECSGGLRGKPMFYRGTSGEGVRVDQGEPLKSEVLPCAEPAQPRKLRLPFLTTDGTLSIPFDSDPKYHWWKGGQSVEQTRAEVVARMGAGRAGQTVG